MKKKGGLTRKRVIFVRLNDTEADIVEAAIKLKYGEVDGMRNLFARQCLLAAAKNIIKAQKRQEEGV